MRLSIPFNGDVRWLGILSERVVDWRRIESVYFAPNPLVAGSGRKPKIGSQVLRAGDSLVFDSSAYDGMIAALLHDLKTKSVRTLMVLNGVCVASESAKLIDYLSRLHFGYGLSGVIVGSQDYFTMVAFKKRFPNLELHNSVYMNANSLEAARRLIDLGLDVFLLPPEVNRRLDTIAEFKRAVSVKLKMMANEGCLPRCPFRQEHQRLSSAYSVDDAMADTVFGPKSSADTMKCMEAFDRRPEYVVKSPWVRPEDLWRYEGLVDSVKIVGRSFASSNIAMVVNAYLAGKYDGDLRALVETFKNMRMPLPYGSVSTVLWDHSFECQQPLGTCILCQEIVGRLMGGAGLRATPSEGRRPRSRMA